MFHCADPETGAVYGMSEGCNGSSDSPHLKGELQCGIRSNTNSVLQFFDFFEPPEKRGRQGTSLNECTSGLFQDNENGSTCIVCTATDARAGTITTLVAVEVGEAPGERPAFLSEVPP